MKIKLISLYLILFLLACSSSADNNNLSESQNSSVNKSKSNIENKSSVLNDKKSTSNVTQVKKTPVAPKIIDEPKDIEIAQKLYPPDITRNLLMKRIPWPENFDLCLSKSIDMNSLERLQSFSAKILDEASLCLLNLEVDPKILINSNIPPMGQPPGTPPMGQQPGIPPSGPQGPPQQGGQPGAPPPKGYIILQEMKVTKQSSSYAEAIPSNKTSFNINQDASMWISGYGFNKSGGPSLFNHPVSISSDGKRLALTDRNNNRILIWESIPTSNIAPDIVIGQLNFETHMEGKSLSELDFPGQVSLSKDGKMLVADSNNNRILVWKKIPTKSGQPADFEINIDSLIDTKASWPWGVWTNGTKLIISVTSGGDNGNKLLIWNTFPSSGSVRPDLSLKHVSMGTPRMIVSNGNYILTGDENGKTECSTGSSSHIWATWPTQNNQPPDACLDRWVGGAIIENKLIAISGHGEALQYWNELPKTNEEGKARVPVLPGEGHRWRGGDGNDAVYVDGKLFVVEYNAGRVSVYNELPSGPDIKPDWALGASKPDVNPYYENWIIQNGVPASNGEKLFIASDFDSSLSVWNKIPGESGVKPDLFYRRFDNAPWDIAVYQKSVFLAGGGGIYGWKNFDGSGALPEIIISDNIGSANLKDLRGVAYNGEYFALSSETGKVWIWKGIPTEDDDPIQVFDIPKGPGRLDANKEWLVISGYPADRFNVKAIKFSDLSSGKLQNISKHNSFPQSAVFTDIGFFISQQGDNQVLGWDSIEDAISGKPPKITLGTGKGTKASNDIKMANTIGWDGSHLWVGEFKFGTRILGFKPVK